MVILLTQLQPFCQLSYGFTPFFVTDDIKTLVTLLRMGLTKDFVAYKQAREIQLIPDMSFGLGSSTSMLYNLRNVIFNPYLLLGSGSRGRPAFVLFNENEETDPLILLTKYAGASLDIVNDASRASNLFHDISASLPVGLAPTAPQIVETNIQESAGTSLIVAWIIAVLILPILFCCFIVALWVYQIFSNQTIPILKQPALVFGKMVDIQKAIEQGVLFIEMVACIGWIIFVVGGGGVANASNATLEPAAMTFLFAIFGFASSTLNYVCAIYKHPPIMIINVILLVISCLGAGHIIESGSRDDITYQGIRLMITGAGLFGAFQAIGAGISASRRMRTQLESDRYLQASSAIAIIGWILVVISFGRLKVDFNLSPGPSFVAFGVTGLLGAGFVILSTLQFNQWLTSFGVGLTTISVFFCGGILSQSGHTLRTCQINMSASGCGYHWSLSVAGAIIYIAAALSILFIRMLNFEPLEDIEARIIAEMQINDYYKGLVNEPSDEVSGILDILKPSQEEDTIYIYLTSNQTLWNAWRYIAVFCFASWTIFLGGFGSLADSGAPTDATAAAVLLSLFGPVCLVSLILALIRNSRVLMCFAVSFSAVAILSGGRIVTTHWLLPNSAFISVIIGCSLFIASLIILICMIFFRVRIRLEKYEFDGALVMFASTRRILLQVTIFLSLLGLILDTIGSSIQLDSTDLIQLRVQEIVPVAGVIVGYISVAVNYLALYFLLSENYSMSQVEKTSRWPVELIICSNIASFTLSLASYIAIGSTIYSAVSTINICLNGLGSCKSGYTSAILCLIGGIVYLFGSVAFSLMTVLYGYPVKLESDPIPKTTSVPDTDIMPQQVCDIDLYSMVLSWPELQHGLKSIIALQILAYLIFMVSFGCFIVPRGLSSATSVFVVFAVLGLASPIQLIVWVLRGINVLQYVFLVNLILNNGLMGYILCSTIVAPGQGYPASMAASALLYIGSSSFLFAGALSWCSFRNTMLRYVSASRGLIFIAYLGWVMFLVGFILQYLSNASGAGSTEELSSWLFLITGCLFAGLYGLQMINSLLVKVIGFTVMGWTSSFGLTVLISNIVFALQTKPVACTILKIIGSLIFTISIAGYVIHKSICSFLELTEEESKRLTWREKMSPFEKELNWIHLPEYKNSLILYFVSIITSLSGIFVLLVTFIILKDAGNHPLTHTLYISGVMGLVGHMFYIYLRWTSFGWLFIISTIVTGGLAGPAISLAALNSASNSYAIIGGCVLIAMGNTGTFAILIKRMKVCDARWFLICMKTVLALMIIGWLFAIIGTGVAGTSAPLSAYPSIIFPGSVCIVYVIFVYIWRPKAPKIKTLGELLGYTIVKKADLKKSLMMAKDEHIEVNRIEEDSELSKNPIFGIFTRRKKPKPIVKRRTINEWMNYIFGSQPFAFMLVVFSMVVYGITAYTVGVRFQLDQDSSGRVQTYLYFIGSMISYIGFTVYIIIVSITCLIDETNVFVKKVATPKHTQKPDQEDDDESTPSTTRNPSLKDLEKGNQEEAQDVDRTKEMKEAVSVKSPDTIIRSASVSEAKGVTKNEDPSTNATVDEVKSVSKDMPVLPAVPRIDTRPISSPTMPIEDLDDDSSASEYDTPLIQIPQNAPKNTHQTTAGSSTLPDDFFDSQSSPESSVIPSKVSKWLKNPDRIQDLSLEELIEANE